MAARRILSPIEQITRSIVVLRQRKVLLDADLATLYGVTTARLNQQVRRNLERFPTDFLFQLTAAEFSALMMQTATSKRSRGGRRKLPLAFTEHGAIMAATVLNSRRAVEMTVYVVRAFVTLRGLLSTNKDLSRKVQALERCLLGLDLKTQRQFKEVYQAIRALMSQPVTKRRGIGFTADLDQTS
jgi:hypothetical protein